MSLHRWLQNLRLIVAPRRGQSLHGRRGSRSVVTHRPHFEVLEDRLTPSFSPITSFPVGLNPQAVAAADFNSDGKLDLAAANYSNVSVLLGNGAGGFGTAQQFATGWWELSSIAVADFNNDTKPDLVVSHLNGFSILMGKGDGAFQSGVTTPPGGSWGTADFVAEDFNNDSNIDLVVTGYDADFNLQYSVRLGDGQGDFTYMWGGYMPGVGYGLAAIDLNNDGNLDVAASDGRVLLGYGNGTFQADWEQQSLLGAGSVAPGDFNGDGNADLVSVSDSVAVLRGRGDGGFDAPIHHSANGTVHTSVATADFNGDGKLDAVVANGDTGTVSTMLGNGDGSLTHAGAFATGTSPSGVSVGDFNGDRRPDVAVANAGSNSVSVLLNDGIWVGTPPPPPPPALSIGDVAVIEGQSGSALASFTVHLAAPSTDAVTVHFATANGTATAGSDYQAASGTLTFAPGETSKAINVTVYGDTLVESDEVIAVNLSNAVGATILDGQGTGTIVNDDVAPPPPPPPPPPPAPSISIGDVTKAEGRKGQKTLFTFTVTLSAAYDQPVTISYGTANGTATTGDKDYVAKSGTITFAPGETEKTITIEVKGDNKREADEIFYLDLYDESGTSLFEKSRGVGTIVNDD